MIPIACRNNNPLNIRFSPMNKWQGQIGSCKGFCKFDTLEHGFRAALVLLCNYQRKGYDTISKIISHWAPATENDTQNYINTVSKRLSALYGDTRFYAPHPDFAHKRITTFDVLCCLCLEMAAVEIGREVFEEHHERLLDAYRYAYKNFKYPELKK